MRFFLGGLLSDFPGGRLFYCISLRVSIATSLTLAGAVSRGSGCFPARGVTTILSSSAPLPPSTVPSIVPTLAMMVCLFNHWVPIWVGEGALLVKCWPCLLKPSHTYSLLTITSQCRQNSPLMWLGRKEDGIPLTAILWPHQRKVACLWPHQKKVPCLWPHQKKVAFLWPHQRKVAFLWHIPLEFGQWIIIIVIFLAAYSDQEPKNGMQELIRNSKYIVYL